MRRRSSALLVASSFVLAACSSRPSDAPGGNPYLEGPRGEQAAGTGTRDVLATDARTSFAKAAGVGWWEIELRLLDDDVDGTGVIGTADAMRVAVDFWAHASDGKVKANGRFALDVLRWLSLTLERDPTDIADIFQGSVVQIGGTDAGDADRAAWLGALMTEIQLETAATSGSTSSALLDGASLGSCVGSGKSALAKAFSAISSTFGACTDCAAKAIDPASDGAWTACGACEKGITDAKKAAGLLDVLACKKALVLPMTAPGDADDAGGSLIRLFDGLTSSTCYASSTDKVRGTYRMTDGKGGVSCGDCPAGTVPFDSKLGCAPADAASGADEAKALVLVPTASGKPPTPRVISSDACVVVDVTGTGTLNGEPLSKGPDRRIYKLGDRAWAALPQLAQTSNDQWNLTSDSHASSQQGKFSAGGASKKDKRKIAYKGTVAEAIARGGCSSRPVYGLSLQIQEELARCIKPGFFVRVPAGGRLNTDADHPFLEKPAADALVRALAARPGARLTVTSMYRTIAQQYFLYSRAACFPAVAAPGRSNHETGIALDVADPDNSTWRATLTAQGYKWFGSSDRYHFDYVGAGSVDLRGLDVKAFQRLWNRNNPDDKIAEDGGFGPDTEKRLRQSPADGFPIGVPASCDAEPAPAPTSKGSREPLPYLTNVTTAALLPGTGCSTGGDASHSSVEGCVTSKMVCEPYWCDLADQRAPACR
jgi:hypothetical protein